jgi:hypothetical protein
MHVHVMNCCANLSWLAAGGRLVSHSYWAIIKKVMSKPEVKVREKYNAKNKNINLKNCRSPENLHYSIRKLSLFEKFH